MFTEAAPFTGLFSQNQLCMQSPLKNGKSWPPSHEPLLCERGEVTGTHETDKSVGKAKIKQGQKDF